MTKTKGSLLSDLFCFLCFCLFCLALVLAFVSWLLVKLEAKTDPPSFNRLKAYEHCLLYRDVSLNFEKISVLLFTEQSQIAMASDTLSGALEYFCPRIAEPIAYEDLLQEFHIISGACWENLEFEYKLINPKPKLLEDQYREIKPEKIRLDGHFGL